ncbi:MAG: rhodanese-like domain-containing protein [Caldisericia bacterium]|nr:rhodanese-like domain-containing protein [Caldisericia bacterium]
MKKKSSLTNTIVNVVALVLFLVFAFSVYHKTITRYEDFKNTPNIIVSEKDSQRVLIDAYENSVLNENKTNSGIRLMKFYLVDFLSTFRLTAKFVSYINSKQDWVEDCSTCALGGGCDDLEKTMYFYPLDVTYDSLPDLVKLYPDLFIVDVRPDGEWEKKHIKNSVPIPLTQVVPYLFPLDRWSEVIFVGDNYLETKLAGEALIRLNFHRVYKLRGSVKDYTGEMEFIDGN